MRFLILALVVSLVPAALGDEIPVVRTYGDLLASPAIPLDGGGTARVGIETRSAPRGGAFTVYCLTEGFEPAAEERSPPERVGPFVLEVRREGRGPDAQKRLSRWTAEEAGDLRLFTRLVALGEGRVCEVRLGGSTATVTAAEPAFHTFFELGPSGDRRLAVRSRRPELPGEITHVAAVDRDVPRTLALPVELPGTPSPGMALSAALGDVPTLSGDTLCLDVMAPHAIVVSHEPSHWLARWWVNGRPVAADPEADVFGLSLSGKVLEADQLTLEVAFDPAALGAAPGDRIEVQLLYHEGLGGTETGPLLTPRAAFAHSVVH